MSQAPESGSTRRPAWRRDSTVRRIVVLQFSFIGDMVFTTPLLDTLRERFTGAEISVVGRPLALEVLVDHPAVDRVLGYDKHDADRGVHGLLGLARAVRRLRPQLVLGVTRSGRTALVARLSGAPRRIGFAGPARHLAYTDVVERDDERRRFPERPLALLEPLGIHTPPRPLHLVVGEPRREAARSRLAAAGWRGEPIAAIAPGANYATKRWPERHVASLLDRLLADGRLRPALYGGPAERPLIARLRAGRAGVLDRSRLRLRDAVAEISLAAVFAAGDTGPLHVARALDVPAVMIAGPTDPGRLTDGRPFEILRLALDCQPCSSSGDDRCPLGHHRCLEDLGPEIVFEAMARAAADPR